MSARARMPPVIFLSCALYQHGIFHSHIMQMFARTRALVYYARKNILMHEQNVSIISPTYYIKTVYTHTHTCVTTPHTV